MTLPLWRLILKKNFVHIDKLADFLNLSVHQKEHLLKRSKFPLNLPLRLANKIEKGNLKDPILMQFLPILDETREVATYKKDPLEEASFKKSTTLISKYTSRVLMIPSPACAMHCRYCFRRHFPYESKQKNFQNELEWIRQNKQLQEVILSGGDPLSLNDQELISILYDLEKITHIKKIRFHTRFPIGIPERITNDLLDAFKSINKQFVFIVHINHPNELDTDLLESLKKIQLTGTPVLCQSVLLKNINDDIDVLEKLCTQLSDWGILPYYIHSLDKVQGAEHFDVPEEKGVSLIKSLRDRIPGYAVPSFVREEVGKKSKTPIFSTKEKYAPTF